MNKGRLFFCFENKNRQGFFEDWAGLTSAKIFGLTLAIFAARKTFGPQG
jgi:hypothetical protein